MKSNDGIKETVEVIEQVDHFDGLAQCGDGGEAHNVTEVQRDVIEVFRFDGLACLQRLSHGPEGGRRRSDTCDDVTSVFLLILLALVHMCPGAVPFISHQ